MKIVTFDSSNETIPKKIEVYAMSLILILKWKLIIVETKLCLDKSMNGINVDATWEILHVMLCTSFIMQVSHRKTPVYI